MVPDENLWLYTTKGQASPTGWLVYYLWAVFRHFAILAKPVPSLWHSVLFLPHLYFRSLSPVSLQKSCICAIQVNQDPFSSKVEMVPKAHIINQKTYANILLVIGYCTASNTVISLRSLH